MKSYCGSSTALLEGLAEVLGMACGFGGSQSCWLGLLGRVAGQGTGWVPGRDLRKGVVAYCLHVCYSNCREEEGILLAARVLGCCAV